MRARAEGMQAEPGAQPPARRRGVGAGGAGAGPGGLPIPKLEDHPVQALVAEHDALALKITAETGRPGWDGITPVDYAGAVDWLLELGPSP